jgi:lipopolysaccharide exporter
VSAPGESGEDASLTTRTITGAKWTYSSAFINAGLQILVTAVLARLLAPEAFGLVVMAGLVLKFGQFFAQMGITQAIVQRATLSRENVRAGFWTSIIVSGAFSAIVWFGAPLVAAAFASKLLIDVLRVMGLSFVFSGFSATASALLLREMRFRGIAIATVASYVLGYAVVGLTTAVLNWGVWSLVAAVLAQSIVASIAYNLQARPAVKPIARWGPYRELLGFGSTLSLTQFLEFVTNNLDSMIVGRVSGSTALGLYSRALSLTAYPMYYMSWSLAQVLFPSFSRVQSDTARVRRAYLSLIAVFAGVGFPVAFGLSGAAREIVLVFLGPHWGPAIPVVRVVGFASAAVTLSRFGVVVLQATARLKDRLIMRGGQLIFFAAALLILGRFGLIGYASAFALSELAFHVALAARVSALYGITARDTFRAYWPGFVGGAAVFVLVLVESWLGRLAGVPFAAVLAVQVTTGAVVLGWVILRARGGHIFRILQGRAEGFIRHAGLKRLLGRLAATSSDEAL